MGVTGLEVGGVKGHLARDSSSSDIRGLQRGLILLQAREWSLRGTRREEDVEPVTHVPAEQVVDGCEEAGLQYQTHHCDHYSVPDLLLENEEIRLEVVEVPRRLQTHPCTKPEAACWCCCASWVSSLSKWEGFRGWGG